MNMDATRLARLIAAGRVGFGVVLVAIPARLTVPWLGDDGQRPAAQVLGRGLGARDLALGVGALAVPNAQLRPWVAAAIAGDAADLLSTLIAGDDVPVRGRIATAAVAAGAVVLGGVALAGLSDDS
jgi:hypothetical protein